MRMGFGTVLFVGAAVAVLFSSRVATSQPPGGGKGGFGPPGGEERKIVKDFDKNSDGWLNADERVAARETAKKGGGFGFGPKGGFGGKGGDRGTPKPGPAVRPGDVKAVPDAPLYDPAVLRTVFLEFENKDWEQELQDFHGTDVDVPATLVVDGKRYPNVGVHFRGMSSYMGVGAGFKRSLNVSLDLADPKQRLLGYKTLNLLNSHDDPSLMNTVLYSHVARKYLPAPRANFVRVVVNGESWGVYASVQQFDKVFLDENYKTTKGTRWKVRGSPGGGGGLEYLGDDPAAYKRRYTMKSADNEDAWKALANFCKVLNQTPPDKLEAALRPIADVDELLWFLALDVALINCDGYWIRASDYTIYLDEKGKFHFVPHDMNEAFRPAGGPGMGGGGPGGAGGPGGGFVMRLPPPGEVLPPPIQDVLGLTDDQKKKLADLQKDVDASLEKLLTDPQKKQLKEMRDRGPGGFGPPGGGPGGGPGGTGGRAIGVELDPLVGLDDTRKPLRSKVLAVPALRAKYLENVRTIAADALDWKKLGPVVAGYRTLIEKEVEADTRKLDSFEAFQRLTAENPGPAAQPPAGGGGGFRGPQAMNVRAFAEQRQKYLLNYQPPKK
ncbi:CotH kinase family protein [Gemmata sp.]|uniref:CotH kinase family protein n=1 Tax=Gemmata sp. TaxID=1914242 RepID=UPI003F72B42C